MTKTENLIKPYLKQNLPGLRPGDTVKVYQRIPALAKAAAGKKAGATKKEEEKDRTQVFEGIVLAMKHGKGISGTFIVRKVVGGIGVERIFPLHSPNIEKIEIVSRGKVRRAKLYYLRKVKGKKAKVKRRLTSIKTSTSREEK